MTAPRLRILLVEDQTDLAASVLEFLEAAGHVVDYVAGGRQGLSLALATPYDVVILDLMLPDLGGLEVCRRLRSAAARHVPVLMLTARDALQDKLTGFEAGADDYLTKPFELGELHARCLALGRRHRLHRETRITIGSLSIDTQARQATRAGLPLVLSNKGFDILLHLAEAYPAAVTRSELVAKLWGDDWPESDALRSHIYALRQALDRPFDTPMLRTVHGVGFQLEADQ